MIRKLFLGCVMVMAMVSVSAGQLEMTWDQTYGGTADDVGYCVQQTADSGFILVGSTESESNGYDDVFLVKTNQDGDEEWSQHYGGSNYDQGSYVQQTDDGGYIIAGSTLTYGTGGWDFYLIKTDALGDTLWTNTIGDSNDEVASCIEETTDGGFIISGHTRSYGNGGYDAYLVKTDASGSLSWDQTFGGGDEDYSNSVQQTSDGGYIIVGWTYTFGNGGCDVYLIKTDANGDSTWCQTFGGSNNEFGYSVRQTTDGGYIVAGTYDEGVNHQFLLIKTDANGDSLWGYTYGGDILDNGISVQQTDDGGFIIAGCTESYGAGAKDVYLIKTDASGNEIGAQTFGGSNNEYGYSVRQTSDGGYIVAGYTESYGAGGSDVYLIKVSPNFNVELTYVSGSPVPSTGGNINYDLLVEYNGTDPIDFDAWLAAEYEGGTPTTLAMRAFFDYQPGWTINRPGMYYPIPASWAAGNYDFFCRVGSEPDVVWAEDSFPFEKLGASDGIAFVPFAVDGAPNPFDDIIASGGIVSQPESHALFTAYPNPFNPTTNLSYNLDAAGQVKLSIYDIQGRLLTTLVDGFRNAGIHEVTFGAEGLSSGIYFARIETGKRSVMQKLMLVK